MNPVSFSQHVLQDQPSDEKSVDNAVLSLTTLYAEPRESKTSLCACLEKHGLPPKETTLVRSILDNRPLSANLCLLDLISLDIDNAFTEIEKVSKVAEEALKEARTSFYAGCFHTYLNLCMAQANNSRIRQSEAVKSFFGGPTSGLESLQKAREKLSSLSQIRSSGSGSSSTKARLQKKVQKNLSGAYAPLVEKISALQTIIASPKLRFYLLDIGLGSFSESDAWDNSPQRHKLLLQYIRFIDNLISDLAASKKIGVETNNFRKLYPLVERLSPNRQNLEQFSEIYAKGVYEFFEQMSHAFHLRDLAIDDPLFTHEEYCRTMRIQRTARHDQKHLIAMINAQIITFQMFSSWMDDIHSIIAGRLVREIDSLYRPSSTYLNRIFALLSCVAAPEPGPFLEATPLESSLSAFVSERFAPLAAFFQKLDVKELNTRIHTLTQGSEKRRFSLMVWIQTFYEFYEIAQQFPVGGKIWDDIREHLLQEVSKIDRPSDKQKQQLAESLLAIVRPYAVMTMILEDTRTLFEGKQLWDVVHLLPDSFVRLVSLEGWNDLFPEESIPILELMKEESVVIEPVEQQMPVPQALPLPSVQIEEQAPTQQMPVAELEELVLPPPPAAKKKPGKAQQKPQPAPKQAPSRKEFLATTKRRLILSFLKEAEFVFSRQAKGSHELWIQQNSGRTVLVPQDVNDPKTRSEMYKSAFGDEDAKMASENDNS